MSVARVCLGRIAGAHGVRGLVRIQSYTERPEDVGAYGPVTDADGERRFEIEVTGRAKGVVIARISGIEDREAAEALKGTRLYVPRAVLPAPGEDEFYYADLVGLAAERADGRPLGRVRAVNDFGAGHVIEIEGPGGEPLVVPFTREVVPSVDLEGGRIVVEPPEGLLAEEGEGEGEGDDEGGPR